MSAMADRIADLCGRCDKEHPSCGRDMNDCLADDEARKIDATHERARDTFPPELYYINRNERAHP